MSKMVNFLILDDPIKKIIWSKRCSKLLIYFMSIKQQAQCTQEVLVSDSICSCCCKTKTRGKFYRAFTVLFDFKYLSVQEPALPHTVCDVITTFGLICVNLRVKIFFFFVKYSSETKK